MRSPNPRALLAVASLAVLLAAADTYVVVLALPDMMAGVGLGIESIQRATPIISGFLLGYVAVLPLIGRLADVLDRSRILLTCMMIFVVGSAVTALAVELPVLVAGRVIQGLGGGGLVPATLAIVADLWPRERRGAPLGVVGAVQELGAVLGPVLGAV
ncbi:MAG: MFS transporter, partial [Lapillicoccus sp.]